MRVLISGSPANGGTQVNRFFSSLRAQATKASASECGQATVLWAFGLLAIVAVTALAIDVGVGYSSRAKAQAGADSASYAAAMAHLLDGKNDEQAKALAIKLAAENGYVNGGDTKVEVNIPPLSGPHAGDSFYIEVIINDRTDTYFADVLGIEFWDVAARSVATASNTSKPYGIIALHPSACKALEVDGNTEIKIKGAGTFTQSSCPNDAFHTQGSIIVDTSDNDVVGGWSTGGSVTPAPGKAYPIVDPLLGLPAPLPPSSPVQACPTFSGKASIKVLQPGVYNCTISPNGQWGLQFMPGNYLITGGISMNGGGDVTFGKGVYTIRGSGLSLNGNGTVAGEEVMFYIEQGQVKLNGTGDMHFTAPESGTYEGVVFFQARSNATKLFMGGNSVQGGWGSVYAPAATIDYTGNANTSFQFISSIFYAHGNSKVTITFDNNKSLGVPYIWITE